MARSENFACRVQLCVSWDQLSRIGLKLAKFAKVSPIKVSNNLWSISTGLKITLALCQAKLRVILMTYNRKGVPALSFPSGEISFQSR